MEPIYSGYFLSLIILLFCILWAPSVGGMACIVERDKRSPWFWIPLAILFGYLTLIAYLLTEKKVSFKIIKQ